MKHSEARELLLSIFQHNIEVLESPKGKLNDIVVPFFVGDPGVGKTDIPKTVAAEVGVPYFQTIVAQYDAGEMAGLPFMQVDEIPVLDAKGKPIHDPDTNLAVTERHTRMIRLRPDYLPDINDPDQRVGIYNLDELPQAFLANQNICSQIVNEWRVGKHQISRGITICATGNKPENKAGTTTMPTHLKDRLTFVSIEPDTDEWLAYASANGVDPRIRAYIRQNPGKLHKFTVGTNANPTPRSWVKCSAYLKMGLKPHIRSQALEGQIGPIATEFETWLRVEDKMPKLEDIIADPESAPVFNNREADVLYLLISALADVTKKENVGQIIKYIRRLPNQEFAAVWAQEAFSGDRKALLNTKEVTEWKLRDGAKLML